MLTKQKIDQTIGILDEVGIDAWLSFVRETGAAEDHVLTWQSTLPLFRGKNGTA